MAYVQDDLSALAIRPDCISCCRDLCNLNAHFMSKVDKYLRDHIAGSHDHLAEPVQ